MINWNNIDIILTNRHIFSLYLSDDSSIFVTSYWYFVLQQVHMLVYLIFCLCYVILYRISVFIFFYYLSCFGYFFNNERERFDNLYHDNTVGLLTYHFHIINFLLTNFPDCRSFAIKVTCKLQNQKSAYPFFLFNYYYLLKKNALVI